MLGADRAPMQGVKLAFNMLTVNPKKDSRNRTCRGVDHRTSLTEMGGLARPLQGAAGVPVPTVARGVPPPSSGSPPNGVASAVRGHGGHHRPPRAHQGTEAVSPISGARELGCRSNQ